MIRTVIADDEPLAREGMRVRLRAEPDIEIAAEAEDGPQAVDAIRTLAPDLAFLDVQMPGLDGFEVVQRVADVHLPAVVFVTAYDQYALKAFDAHALDYLLKPFTSQRFQDALQRARSQISRDAEIEVHRKVMALLEARKAADLEPTSVPRIGNAPAHLDRFTVKEQHRFVMVKADEVDWIESAANYVRLHGRAGRSWMIRITMGELEERLDPRRFARVHRKAIVNLDRIREIKPGWHGDFEVVLDSGKTLRLSRGYRERLLP